MFMFHLKNKITPLLQKKRKKKKKKKRAIRCNAWLGSQQSVLHSCTGWVTPNHGHGQIVPNHHGVTQPSYLGMTQLLMTGYNWVNAHNRGWIYRLWPIGHGLSMVGLGHDPSLPLFSFFSIYIRRYNYIYFYIIFVIYLINFE